MNQDFVAGRAQPAIVKPRGSNVHAEIGLRYERRVKRALMKLTNDETTPLIELEHNPWFSYAKKDSGLSSVCAPDFLLYHKDNFIIVIEVKLTYVNEAITKLQGLYCPIVETALNLPAKPLVITRHLIPSAPKPNAFTLSEAINNPPYLLQWLGHGGIIY